MHPRTGSHIAATKYDDDDLYCLKCSVAAWCHASSSAQIYNPPFKHA